MPDIALLHGRMMVIAWDAELDGGEFSRCSTIYTSVHSIYLISFLKTTSVSVLLNGNYFLKALTMNL